MPIYHYANNSNWKRNARPQNTEWNDTIYSKNLEVTKMPVKILSYFEDPEDQEEEEIDFEEEEQEEEEIDFEEEEMGFEEEEQIDFEEEEEMGFEEEDEIDFEE